MNKKIIAGLISASILGTNVYAHPFTDVSGHWAESEIEYGYENKIISGYGDGLFKPNNTITRAEFVKMIVASVCDNLSVPIPEPKNPEHWATMYSEFAVNSQLINVLNETHDNVTPGLLEGESYDYPIKRWEMAYILNEAMSALFDIPASEIVYPDMPETISSYGENINNAICNCINVNLIKGDENGNFNASSTGTRAQALTLCNRLDREIKLALGVLTSSTDGANENNAQAQNVKTYTEIPTGHPQVKVEMENGEAFTIELYPEYAPQTVANFVYLVNNGFYNGLKFHRIIDDFMAQGGDPLGTGIGGSSDNILGEFKSNGVDNPLSHERGVISMARSANKNSASSQFFICYDDCTFLDGEYAAFGKVIEGMETVDNFLKVERISNGTEENALPVTDIIMKSVTLIK